MSDTPRLGIALVANTVGLLLGAITLATIGVQRAPSIDARYARLCQHIASAAQRARTVDFLLEKAVLVGFGLQDLALAGDTRVREILRGTATGTRAERQQTTVHDVFATRLTDERNDLLVQAVERLLIAAASGGCRRRRNQRHDHTQRCNPEPHRCSARFRG